MELDFVQWLGEHAQRDPRLLKGIGDDAAVVRLAGRELVTAADLLIDGVHFSTDEHAPQRIGRKALAVNLSDLAAMAARPAGALLSLSLPRSGAGGLSPAELARQLVAGLLPLAEEFNCPLVGGDTNTGPGPLVLAVTVFGEPTERGAALRSGAHPGDALLVTGTLGGSLSGKHLDFTPRVDEALRLADSADVHAMIDLSDGLSLDLNRLCRASGVGAIVDAQCVPITPSIAEAPSPLEHALCDGEDFELLLTVSPEDAQRLLADPPFDCGLAWIGEVTAGDAVLLRRADGETEPLAPKGYEHR